MQIKFEKSHSSLTAIEKLQRLKAVHKASNTKMPVIFDTDVGYDPDDLQVLVSGLINDKDIDLKMVITTGDFTDVKARLVKYILAVMGRQDVKVFSGKNLQLKDHTPYDENDPNSMREALKKTLEFPEETQIKILEETLPTFPGTKKTATDISFGGFYPFQGRAWDKFNFYAYKEDGSLDTATEFLCNLIKEQAPDDNMPKIVMVSTGELSNIAYFYKKDLAKEMLMVHMGGWTTTRENDIFPREYIGRNTCADITAAEVVFSHPDANVVIYMSQLKKRYNLEFTGNIRKLFCLVDEMPVSNSPEEELPKEATEKLRSDVISQKEMFSVIPDKKLLPLLSTLLKDLHLGDYKPSVSSELDLLMNELMVKSQDIGMQLYLKKLNNQEVTALCKSYSPTILRSMIKALLPTAGQAELPHADELGKAIARDFANWFAWTASPFIICSDPGTFIIAAHPEVITETKQVSIEIDSAKAIKIGDKLMRSKFVDSIKTTLNDKDARVSVVSGLSSREEILEPIISGLLTRVYPGVAYKEFMKIAESKEPLKQQIEALNDIILSRKIPKGVHNISFMNTKPIKDEKLPTESPQLQF